MNNGELELKIDIIKTQSLVELETKKWLQQWIQRPYRPKFE